MKGGDERFERENLGGEEAKVIFEEKRVSSVDGRAEVVGKLFG